MYPICPCARSVCCAACAVSLATWLPFTSVRARCVVWHVRCPWPLGSRLPVCPLGVLCCAFGVLVHLAPVHQCARWVCCVACAVSLATWLPFTTANFVPRPEAPGNPPDGGGYVANLPTCGTLLILSHIVKHW